jgi:hypothetical protein
LRGVLLIIGLDEQIIQHNDAKVLQLSLLARDLFESNFFGFFATDPDGNLI